jgi:hypothetical protein
MMNITGNPEKILDRLGQGRKYRLGVKQNLFTDLIKARE